MLQLSQRELSKYYLVEYSSLGLYRRFQTGFGLTSLVFVLYILRACRIDRGPLCYLSEASPKPVMREDWDVCLLVCYCTDSSR